MVIIFVFTLLHDLSGLKSVEVSTLVCVAMVDKSVGCMVSIVENVEAPQPSTAIRLEKST